MANYILRRFRQQPLQRGDRIHLEDGPRHGDWEVMAADEHKVTLRCPVSHRVIDVDPFYFMAAEVETDQWPTR